jgi:adenylylsulfate kinase-like enzyme
MENIQELKKEYAKLQKKYSLPSFEELNQDFGIERASEFEGELLIREIRRYINDTLSNYMRLIENLINPMNVPVFIFTMIKFLEQEDKKTLSGIYKKLGQIQINLIGVDLIYSEKNESEFIKDSFEVWQIVKKDLFKIIEKIKLSKENKPADNDKNYFG